jgi:hypothetical protein
MGIAYQVECDNCCIWDNKIESQTLIDVKSVMPFLLFRYWLVAVKWSTMGLSLRDDLSRSLDLSLNLNSLFPKFFKHPVGEDFEQNF